MTMRKPELLAPAGDLKRAKTAIRYGADAVYLGGMSYSLRSRASNFTMDDIAEACAYAKEHNARIHVTVNVIPHNEDFEGLKAYLIQLEKCGVTAIIAASPSIMKLAKTSAPKLEVHCSTQMSVTNSNAIRYLKEKLDIDRAVLGRECTMDQVRKIVQNSPVDIEAFIHGGMCINYSGRCTLSNRMTLRDANRGGCAQSCRWSYHLYDQEQEITTEDKLFTMGSRDLCAAEYLYDLMNAGVASLKIECRMKTEYYVAAIVSAYRHMIDEIYETGRLPKARAEYHEHEILRGENRETCTGFYSGKAGLESLIYHVNSDADVSHDFLGTVKEIEDNGKVIIETRNPFALGDEVEFLSAGKENRKFVLRNMKNYKKQEEISEIRNPMTLVEIEVPFTVGLHDILRKA